MRYLLISFLLFVACTSSERRRALIERAPTFAIEAHDARGSKLRFEHPPQRFIILSPEIAEIFYYFNAQNTVVATSSLCKHFGFLEDVPTITTFPSLAIDTIPHFQPHCILLSGYFYSENDANQIQEYLQIPVFFYFPTDLKSMNQQIFQIGKLLGDTITARAIYDTITTTLKHIEKTLKNHVFPPVVVFTDLLEWQVIGKKHFFNDVLHYCGAYNAVDSSSFYATITPEILMEIHPDFILIPEDQETFWYRILEQMPFLTELEPVKKGNVIVYRPDEYLLATPRVLIIIETLKTLFAPQ